MRKLAAVGVLAAMIAALAGPAGASTQTVDATLGSTLSMATTPDASVSWSLASSGANTTSGGTMELNANQPYAVAVTADKAKMTEHDGSAYVTGGQELTSALSVIAARTGGTAAVPGVGATAVVGTSTALAAGTGLGTDTYSVTLSQPTLITDPALDGTNTYRIVLTYTASSTL